MNKYKSVGVIIMLLTVSVAFAQVKILPGDKSINPSFLKAGNYSMSYTIDYNGKWVEIGTYNSELVLENKYLKVNTVLAFSKSDIKWTDNFVADARSFKPVSSYSDREERILSLSFSSNLTGEYTQKKSQKKNSINQPLKADRFDVSVYPYIIQMLPLDVGYRAIIPIFDYEASDKTKDYNAEIKEVRSDVYLSDFTGEHKVWRVAVLEENSGHHFQYFIDKSTRRIWKISIVSAKGDKIVMKEKEAEYNPFKNKFDKKEVLSMVNEGNSSITGIAFARDNENEGLLKGMAVLNINKKQFAVKGTTIVLIPYTPYLKEWIDLNEKQRKIKNAKAIPLPEDAYDCFKTATVYDDNGRFEFTNLKPGDYMLVTAFGYKHTSRRTEETGRGAVIVNGAYQGDHVYTSVFAYSSNATANIQKIVTIKKAGDKVDVKLKKTL